MARTKKKATAWSYSRYSCYKTCGAQYNFRYNEKLPEESNPAMERGEEVHKLLAAYVRKDIPAYNPRDTAPIPGWTYFGELLNELRDMDVLVEQEWGFTDRWKPTGWFGDDTWFRSKLDVGLVYDDGTADVIDYKTGKERAEHGEQAELYALSVFCRYGQIKNLVVRFWYLDSGGESVHRFSQDMAESLLKKWTKRAEKMLMDSLLVPSPGYHCKWCSYAASKGGPCRYG